jgi:hypothetical protein
MRLAGQRWQRLGPADGGVGRRSAGAAAVLAGDQLRQLPHEQPGDHHLRDGDVAVALTAVERPKALAAGAQ